jgi:hypothetical protein
MAAGGHDGVTRWLVLDVRMPAVFRPLRPLITTAFDKENGRTMAAQKAYAESRALAGGFEGPAHLGGGRAGVE